MVKVSTTTKLVVVRLPPVPNNDEEAAHPHEPPALQGVREGTGLELYTSMNIRALPTLRWPTLNSSTPPPKHRHDTPGCSLRLVVVGQARDEGVMLGEPLVERCKTITGSEAYKISFEATANSAGTIMQRLLDKGVGQSVGYGAAYVLPLDLHASASPRGYERQDSVPAEASLLAIEQYIHVVEKGTTFSFDYGALLVIAGLLAGIGE